MSTSDNNILGLQLPTDPRWVNLAEMDLAEILSDHAYCEQKAASQCISLIQKYPLHDLLLEKLSPIVTEEWGHFRQVVQEMKKRNLTLSFQRRDEYVNQLITNGYKGSDKEKNLLDKLLICALIEARSCERFRLLSVNLKDEDLQTFYYKFMVSEASHYRLFIDIAKHYFEESIVNTRWKEWLEIEKIILNNLTVRGDRIH